MSSYTPPTYYFNSIDFNPSFYQNNTSGYALDNAVVHKLQNETISGAKTFNGNTTLSQPLSLLYNPSNTSSRYLGYIATAAGTGQAMTTNVFNTFRNTPVPIGSWLICMQFLLTATTAGTITVSTFGVSNSNTSYVAAAAGATLTSRVSQTYALNETAIFTVCFPFQTTTATTLFGSSTLTFTSGAYTIAGTYNTVKVG